MNGHLDSDLLLKQAIISVLALQMASERWQQEARPPSATAPLWLDERERDRLLAALKRKRGREAKLLRQDLQRMFETAA